MLSHILSCAPLNTVSVILVPIRTAVRRPLDSFIPGQSFPYSDSWKKECTRETELPVQLETPISSKPKTQLKHKGI